MGVHGIILSFLCVFYSLQLKQKMQVCRYDLIQIQDIVDFFTSEIWGNDILLLQEIWTDLTSLKLETSSRLG